MTSFEPLCADTLVLSDKTTDAPRLAWPRGAHERRVEHFYSHGAARYGDYHGGFLNFGLWDDGITSYEEAARNLVVCLAQWGKINESSRLLDVGCGMGPQDVLMWQTCHPRELIGLDVTFEHVEAARERAHRENLPSSVRFEHGTATDLPFASDSFSHVTCIEGGVHFNTRERFFHEALRVLQPGGTLLVADYALKKEPRNLLARALVWAVSNGWCIPRENCNTVTSFRGKLHRLGFAAIELRCVGDRTYPQYYREQRGWGHLRMLFHIRGAWATFGGFLIDSLAYLAWKCGAIDYVLVRAEKPMRA